MAVGSGVDVDGGVVVVVLTSTPALSEGDLVVVPVWPSQRC